MIGQGEQQSAQPAQQSEVVPAVPTSPLPVIGDDQWNKDITGILTSNANNAIAELGFNPNVLRALKAADNDIAKLEAEKKILESKNRDLSAHLALANNRIDFSRQDTHAIWKEVIYYREKYHVLQRQHQEVLRAHSTCATGPPEQPYVHLLQELEKLQDMYRHILGQNTTLKFEVQRLMQQCVNAGLIPPPLNYNVTPIPALQPPALQPATARRVSEPAVVGRQQQIQIPAQYTQGLQPGPVVRQFVSPPSNPYATNLPVASNQTIVAGPVQAYNYHRAHFPQPQQVPAQLMSPPQHPQQTLPQQVQPPVPQQQIPATRPRPVIDLTNSDDERAPKRPRMASDPNVYTQHPREPVTHFQHQVHAQMPAQAPYQVLQQRHLQPRLQGVPMDYMQVQPMQQYYPQRSGTGPTYPYQQVSPQVSPYVGPYGASFLPNAPAPPISAPAAMDAYGAVTGSMQTQGQLLDANDQPQQMRPSTADAGTNITTTANTAEAPAERSIGTPLGSTPAAPPPDSAPVSPQVMASSRTHGGESSLPPLTEEQIKQMRSELADSMFTEPREDDET
ncbi:hypothetical protein BDM02DRAFT_3107491 [Thelephora ganbajun]|uniref:Uncharacterized protein n=1 Tax=Thelephora ganbajun TaxID=370292 RepID=A0ACB6ZVE8_THEGA|nr:hypothetical protein BDM02DRAFT_3107491 [Thelephora ganbajun]